MKKMKVQSFLLTIVVVSLFSCRTATVRVEYNEGVDFFKFKTYNWLHAVNRNTAGYESLQSQKVISIMEEILSAKNLAKSDKPDLLIALNISDKERLYYRSHNSLHYGFRHWGYRHTYVYEPEYYTESTLFVVMVDPETKKSLWEGSVKDWRFNDISIEEQRELLYGLLEHFPPVNTEAYQ